MSDVLAPDDVGFLVTGEYCTRCGDVNFEEDARVCLTCTHPDDPNSVAYLAGRDVQPPHDLGRPQSARYAGVGTRGWLTGNVRGSVDGDVVRLGTEGEGIGVVYYRITGDIPPDDGTAEGQGSWVTLQRVA